MVRSGGSQHQSQQNSISLVLAAVLGVGVGLGMSAIAVLFLSKWKSKNKEDTTTTKAPPPWGEISSMQTIRTLPQDRDLVPPLPLCLIDLLHRQSTCQLATVDHGAPHLSQMRFTHVGAPYDVLVFSTRRNTTKFRNLQTNKQLAVIFHDENISVTVYGSLEILDGKDAEILRAEHLKKNVGYEQFIVGDQIAILAVRITRARICNINDQVSEWTATTAS